MPTAWRAAILAAHDRDRRTNSPAHNCISRLKAEGEWGILNPVKLTARQIERLVKRGEVVHTECKDASGGLPDSLWKSYSSFANTDGGVILLGVKDVDRKFSIAGVPKAATLIKRFWDGVNNREKTIVNIAIDSQSDSDKNRTEPDHNPDTTRTEPVQGVPQCAPRIDNKLDNKLDNKSDLMSSLDNNSQSSQGGPRPDQDPTKTRPRSGQLHGLICRHHVD